MKRYCISVLLIAAFLWIQVAYGAVGGSRQPYKDSFYTGEGWTRDSRGNIHAIVPTTIALTRESLGGKKASVHSPDKDPLGGPPSDQIPIVDAEDVKIETSSQEIRVLNKVTGISYNIPFKIVGKSVLQTLGRLNNHEMANQALNALNNGEIPSLFELSLDENGDIKIKVYEPPSWLTKIPGFGKVFLFAQKLEKEISRLRDQFMPLLQQTKEKG